MDVNASELMTHASPFHHGEQQVQQRLGVREQVEELGQRFIRDHMPQQHREFYGQLQYLLLGSIDVSGRPWASIVVGPAGFIDTPDEQTLRIKTRRVFGDRITANLNPEAPIGVLGIQFETRRRNRLTAKIARASEDEIVLNIVQTFGNCPQYIQARELEPQPEMRDIGSPRPTVGIDKLNRRAKDIVAAADNFYIATGYAEDPEDPSHGADVSHRGGKPGFVRIEDDRTLVFPDFAGNNHYNTIGNISLNPVAGLLFIDFDSGDILQLTCSAEIIWDSEERRAFKGAERLVRFTVDEGVLIEQALPVRWRFLDYSPVLDATGSWQEVDETIAARRAESRARDYRVARVERESDVISSFYLVPADDGSLLCHQAGQFLPIELRPPALDSKVRRTYTISNAPNGEYYRLSIKREPARSPELPPGLSSNFFHDHVQPGSIIRAYPPRGQFVLSDNNTRPVVLLSGGVGVTPMISMLEQLHAESMGCGCNRQVWFIHGAINGRVHAFRDRVRQLAANWPCLHTHIIYSSPDDQDLAGRDYDGTGFVDIELLKQLLPLDDYEYYFCGPPPFMQSVYDGLRDLSVRDDRLHYEFFGPGMTLHDEAPANSSDVAVVASDQPPVPVVFASSGIESTWDPTKGSLLDLAESEGLTPLYSCRSGTCATCQVPVLSGSITYADPPIAEPEAGNALICCAYPSPHSDELTLDL